jgi:hypothetical protein
MIDISNEPVEFHDSFCVFYLIAMNACRELHNARYSQKE